MPEFLELLVEVTLDTLKLILPLFAVYLLIEYVEHRRQLAFLKKISGENRFSSFWGSLFGCIPQCGFSGIASELFSHRFITLGTLLAVFLTTSDEAVPVLLSHISDEPLKALSGILVILGIKLVYGFLIGFSVDFIMRKKQKNHAEKCEHFNSAEDCSEHADCGNHHGECGCHHSGKNEGKINEIFFPAVKHTAKITVFLFAVNLIISIIIFIIKEENLRAILIENSALTPLFSAALGLIPSCAVSVLLTELYFDGMLSLAAVSAGLASGAGIGLFVLFKSNKSLKQNLLITLLLFGFGLALGYLIYALSFIF